MRVTGERLVQLLLWIVLCVVLVHEHLEQQSHGPRYRCVVYGSRLGVHDQLLCFDPSDGRMFRPERRFNRFTMQDGEP